jgi:hypothetical protein
VGKSFVVYAQTPEEKKEWMTEFAKLQRTDNNTNIDVGMSRVNVSSLLLSSLLLI